MGLDFTATNFNGYAYILMLKASQGGHYVLFPTKQFSKNRFQTGTEILQGRVTVVGRDPEKLLTVDVPLSCQLA